MELERRDQIMTHYGSVVSLDNDVWAIINDDNVSIEGKPRVCGELWRCHSAPPANGVELISDQLKQHLCSSDGRPLRWKRFINEDWKRIESTLQVNTPTALVQLTQSEGLQENHYIKAGVEAEGAEEGVFRPTTARVRGMIATPRCK
eukprot:5480489-Prymnesium_polylepis.1